MAVSEWLERMRPLICRLSALLILGSGTLAAQVHRAERLEPSSLQQFLEVRGLDRLRIREAQMHLAREVDPERQAALGRRLANLYQASLLSGQWKAVDPSMIQQARQLLANDLANRNAGLALAIEHAWYFEVEQNLRDWFYQGRDSTRQGEVMADLVNHCDRLAALVARLEAEVRGAQILPEATPREVNSKNLALEALERRLAHGHYLLGWASFYRGILGQQESGGWLTKSQKHFRRFLQLPMEGPLPNLQSWQPDWQQNWQWRSLLGIAMGLRARGEQLESDALFRFLDEAGTENLEARWLEVWNLESMALAGQWERAADFVERAVTVSWEPGKQRAFWRRVLQASRAARLSAPENAEFMQVQALLALARNRESTVLQAWRDDPQSERVGNPFVKNWIDGYLGWVEVEQGGELNGIGSTFSLAIEMADTSISVADLDRCRFYKALVDFRCGNLCEAAQQFAEVARSLQRLDPPLAEESAWLNLRSCMAMAMIDRRKTPLALAAIDEFESIFPASLLVEEIPFQKLRLTCHTLPPRQAMERLERFKIAQPEIYQVRIELVRSLYRLWQEQLEVDQQAAQDARKELERANRELQDDPRVGGKSKLRSMLWAIDAMLQSEVAPAELEAVLSQAVELAALPGTPIEMIDLLTYYRMTFARQAGKQEAGIELARQLAAQAVGTSLERSALLYLAESYPASGELDAETRSAAMTDLLRLVELLGSDRLSLAQSRNARVALFRLSELYMQSRQWERADGHLELLVEVFPQRREYRAAAARVKTERGHFQQALPHWRFLAQGAEPGTDLWYEAKYQLIRCLWSIDDDSAKAVLQQTIQLSPSLPEGWAGRYALLAEEMGLGD